MSRNTAEKELKTPVAVAADRANRQGTIQGTIQGPLRYVGPTRADMGVVHNRMYACIPGSAQKLFTQLPELERLFLPSRAVPIAQKQIRLREGAYYSAYRRVMDFDVTGGAA